MMLDELVLARAHCSLPGNTLTETSRTLSTALAEKTYHSLWYWRC